MIATSRALTPKWGLFAAVVAAGLALDVATKRWALAELQLGLTRHALGGVLPLTLSFNRGIAFGLHLGQASRAVFTAVGVVVLVAVLVLYASTPAVHRARLLAVALMCAGAIGNLVDRIAHPVGVIDFLGPFDLRFMVWPIFNLADVWVVAGTAGLALSLWWSRRHEV